MEDESQSGCIATNQLYWTLSALLGKMCLATEFLK